MALAIMVAPRLIAAVGCSSSCTYKSQQLGMTPEKLHASNSCRLPKINGSPLIKISSSNMAKGSPKLRYFAESDEESGYLPFHHVCRSPSSIAATVFSIASEESPNSISGENCMSFTSEASMRSNEDLKSQELNINLNLPRRTVQVTFTCNVCSTRSQRFINPNAYRRGTVYVQCAGCEVYHQLVDNLGLVVEYDFREDADGIKEADALVDDLSDEPM